MDDHDRLSSDTSFPSPEAAEQLPGRSTRGSRRRHVPLAFKVALLLFSIVSSIAIAEVAVRLGSEEGTSLLVKDSIVGQRYRAGFSEERFVPEAGRTIHLRFNRLGYRGGDTPFEKPPATRRVAVLGDSFIAAVAVEEQDTLVEQLESMLNGTSGDYHWEGLNFGISGNGTAQSLLAWRHFVHDFAPDLVILCFYNGNDLADNCANASSAHRPYFRLDEAGQLVFQPVSEKRATLSRWLSDYSQLYVWQKHKFRLIRDRFRQAADILPPGFQIFNNDPPAPFPEAWAVTEQLIATLAHEVQQTGARFLLVGIPAHEQVMEDYWRRLLDTVGPDSSGSFDIDYPERRLGEICQRHGIAYLPLVDVFREGCRRESLHFIREGHWNERGNRLAAETIYRHLIGDREGARPIASKDGESPH